MRTIVTLTMFWISACFGAAQADDIQDQRLTIAAEFESAFASGDGEALALLVDGYGPADAAPTQTIVTSFRRNWHTAGGIELYGVRPSTVSDDRLIVYGVRAVQRDFTGIVLDFDGPTLTDVRPMDLLPPADFVPSADNPLSDSALTAEEAIRLISQMMDRAEAAENFSGQLLIQRNDDVLLSRAYGQANRRFGVSMTVDTPLAVASVNKMITAVSILQLAESGALELSDTVYDHLQDEWINEETAKQITIEQLLSHTSGLGTFFTEEWSNSNQFNHRNPSDYIPLIHEMTPEFEPGSEQKYSNVGYLLLGAVIASVTGETYFDYIEQHIIIPASMNSNPCFEVDRTTRPFADGYEPDFTTNQRVLWVDVPRSRPRGGPAGGCYFTASDLALFGEALRSGQLISADMLAIATSQHTPPGGPSFGYGFSLFEGEAPMATAYGHAGGFDGVTAAFWHYPNDGWTVVLISNLGDAGHPLWGIETYLARVQ